MVATALVLINQLIIHIQGKLSGMVTVMNSSMTKRKYIQYIIPLIMLLLAVPAHAFEVRASLEKEAGSNVEDKYFGLMLARNGDKKHRYQKEHRLNKENRHKEHRSLDESISRVQRHMKGKIISAHSYKKGERSYHRIKVLTPDGVVRVMLVDPETGDME